MKSVRLVLILMFPFFCNAQIIQGFVYDSESTIKGAKLVNTSQNILSYSDDTGRFEINVQLNDTIVVSSYFHKPQTFAVSEKHLNKDIVIELKKITNELDEVDITKVREKQVDTLKLKQTTIKQGQMAFKERVFGSGENLQPTLDIIKLASLIGKLFKKEKQDIPLIRTEDLVTLFDSSGFFTKAFLRDELEISKDYEFLFFEYVQAQQLQASLLSKDKEFYLLDKLLGHGKAFNSFLLEHQND